MTTLTRKTFGTAAAVNVPDIVLAINGLAWASSQGRGLEIGLAFLHALAAPALFLLDPENFLAGAILGGTESLKAAGFGLQSGGHECIGALLVLLVVAGQCRAAASYRD